MYEDELSKNMADVFANRNFISTVDGLARRYGKLPHQILTELSIFDFTINVAIMVAAIEEEAKAHEKPKGKQGLLSKFGLGHEVKKKVKR
jgi:hypothetical protein